MPLLNLKDRKIKSPWKSLAKSILSPYAPKNKLILREILKSYENLKSHEDFSIKKMGGYLSRNFDQNPKITILKKTPKPVSFQRVSTIQSDIPDDFLTISPQQTYISTRPFGIYVRRRSCNCVCCGETSKFQAKIDKFLPISHIKYFCQEKKKSNQINKIDFTSRKSKINVNAMDASISRSQNNIRASNFSPRIMFKSAMLKNPIESFIKNKRTSLVVSKEIEDLIELNNFEIKNQKKKEKFFQLKKVTENKVHENKVAEAIKWKYKPGEFLDKLLKKNERISKEIRIIYGKGNLDDIINEKKRSCSFSIQKKEDFINNAYDSKNQINFFKETVLKIKRIDGKKLPLLNSFHVNPDRNKKENSINKSLKGGRDVKRNYNLSCGNKIQVRRNIS